MPSRQRRVTAMSDLTPEELLLADKAEDAYYRVDKPGEFALRLLASMEDMPPHGVPINVHRHLLQTATRCLRAGQPEELVVVGLLHDIGAAFTGANHAEISAQILRPFVSEENFWLLQKHAVFQEYFYAHKIGGDRFRLDAYRGHPYFEATFNFCELWDQASFDPDYEELPLPVFEPMVRRIFSRPAWVRQAALPSG